jgi:hypothetical protein
MPAAARLPWNQRHSLAVLLSLAVRAGCPVPAAPAAAPAPVPAGHVGVARELLEPRPLPLSALSALLAHQLAELLELLPQLLGGALRLLLVVHAGELLGAALEVGAGGLEVAREVLRGLGDLALEVLGLAPLLLPLLLLSGEPLGLALPAPQQRLLLLG